MNDHKGRKHDQAPGKRAFRDFGTMAPAAAIPPPDDRSPSPDRRQSERFMTILRVGVVKIDDRRELCLIRNISTGGVMIHAYSDLTAGQQASIEFRNGRSVDAEVRWTEGELAGLAFLQPENVRSLLENEGASGGRKARPPRVPISCFATLGRNGDSHPILVHDISQGGVKIEGGPELAAGDHVVISLPDMAAVAGTVRWVNKALAGIAFVKPLGYPDLANWLRQICAAMKSTAQDDD